MNKQGMILAVGIVLIAGNGFAGDNNFGSSAPVQLTNTEMPAVVPVVAEDMNTKDSVDSTEPVGAINKETAPAEVVVPVENAIQAVPEAIIVPVEHKKEEAVKKDFWPVVKKETALIEKQESVAQQETYQRVNAGAVGNKVCPLTGKPLNLQDPKEYTTLSVGGFIFNVLPRAKSEYDKDPVQYADKISVAISNAKMKK